MARTEGSDATAEAIARLGPARLAQAITAPSSLLVAGAVGGIAVAAAGPAGLAAGVVAWLVMTARRLKPRQVLRGATAPTAIDPFAISDPWRRAVLSAQSAQLRFDRAVDDTAKGPLRDRLDDLGEKVRGAVNECWTVAVKGDQLDDAIRELDVRTKRLQYDEAVRAVRQNRDPDRTSVLEMRRDALASQAESAGRLLDLSQETEDRLGKLNAQLDELVTRCIELSVTSDTADDVGELGSGVDNVVAEMEALRRAMEETSAIGRSGPAKPAPTAMPG